MGGMADEAELEVVHAASLGQGQAYKKGARPESETPDAHGTLDLHPGL